MHPFGIEREVVGGDRIAAQSPRQPRRLAAAAGDLSRAQVLDPELPGIAVATQPEIAGEPSVAQLGRQRARRALDRVDVDLRQLHRGRIRVAVRRGHLDRLHRRQLARGRRERDVGEFELQARLAQFAVGHRDHSRDRALAAARAGCERRQEVVPAGELHPVDAQLDARAQLVEVIERAAHASIEFELATEARRQLRRALGGDVVAVAAQREAQVFERPRPLALHQVAVGDARVLDHHAPGGQAVEVEWRLVGRPLPLPEQADAAVGQAHHGDVRAEEPQAAGDQLAGAEEIPQVEADRGFARLEQRLLAVAVEHAHVAQHDLRAEPAQARVEAAVLDAQVRLLLDPRLHAIGVRRHLRDQHPQRAEHERGEDDQHREHAGRDAPPAGGTRSSRRVGHMGTTSY